MSLLLTTIKTSPNGEASITQEVVLATGGMPAIITREEVLQIGEAVVMILQEVHTEVVLSLAEVVISYTATETKMAH